MAMREESPDETSVKQNTPDGDFTPPVEMMVHDYDDERTLEEEEALGPLEDPQVELSSLEKEGNMPLEDLMAMYGYGSGGGGGGGAGGGSASNDGDGDGGTGDNVESASGDRQHSEMNGDNKSSETDTMDIKSEPSELEQIYNDVEPDNENETAVRATRLGSRAQSEDDEDYDYYPEEEEEKKKTIMVGSDYQAWIPEILCKYGDALPYENKDTLVWDPSNMSTKEIEDYLMRAQESPGGNSQGVKAIPTGKHTRDDEEALYLLLQCGHNVEEALRRRKINSTPQDGSMSLWSEEECRLFENGLRSFGKDFRQIQLHKVRTRSVGELVQFYYLWKKTERHDMFAYKSRLEKKKYSLHPGITDYMDRFLEEQEGPGGRDRSTSPNIHSLLYGDPKWQKSHEGQTQPQASATVDGTGSASTAESVTGTTPAVSSSSSSSLSATSTAPQTTASNAPLTSSTTTTSSSVPTTTSNGGPHSKVKKEEDAKEASESQKLTSDPEKSTSDKM